MKSIFKWLLMLLVAGSALFAYFDKPQFNTLISSIAPPAPCKEPITYSLGAFDTKFGISKSAFLADVAKAAKIWDDAAGLPAQGGKNLFAASATGTVKINLIYDYRQAATEKLKSIGLVINNDKSTFDSLKTKYDSLLTSYKSDKATFDRDAAKAEADKSAYEKQVEYWNSQGGAPKSEYQKLEEEKNTVNAEIDALNQKQANLNNTADTINSLSTVINQLIDTLNLNVSKYNNTSSSTGEEFDEGEYISDASGQRIDIYQFANEDKLVRVLAHELGHALGMQHVSDPKAIMYKLNQSSNEKPTAADIAELDRVCKIK